MQVSKIINFSFLLSIFFALSPFIRLDWIDIYYNYVIIALTMPYLIYKIRSFPKKVTYIVLIFFLIGLINVFKGDNSITNLLKIIIGVFSSTLYYDYVIKYNNFDIDKLFKWFLNGSVVVSAIGLIQYFSYEIGFQPGYDFRWMGIMMLVENGHYSIHSIFSEPAHFVTAIMPAALFAVYNIIFNKSFLLSKLSSVTILLSIMLSGSSTGYIGIFFILILILLNNISFKLVGVTVVLVFVSFSALYDNLPKFQRRFDASTQLFIAKEYISEDEADATEGSSMTIYNHYHIAVENFKQHPLFGTGVGSHATAHQRYSLFPNNYFNDYNINDACNMFNRLLSETGLFGIGSISFFFYSNFISKKSTTRHKKHEKYWLYSASTIVAFLVRLLRQGHYFIYGFPFFILIYFYNHKKFYLSDEDSR